MFDVLHIQQRTNIYEDGDLRLPASIAIVEGHSDGDLFYFEKLIHQPKGYVCPEGKDFRMMVINIIIRPMLIVYEQKRISLFIVMQVLYFFYQNA